MPDTDFVLLCLIVGLIAGIIIVIIEIRKMKTVSTKYEASDHLDWGSFVLRRRSDVFLYQSVTRTKVESKSSGSSR